MITTRVKQTRLVSAEEHLVLCEAIAQPSINRRNILFRLIIADRAHDALGKCSFLEDDIDLPSPARHRYIAGADETFSDMPPQINCAAGRAREAEHIQIIAVINDDGLGFFR